jgi:vacuolar-type H+-ATPase subunit H
MPKEPSVPTPAMPASGDPEAGSATDQAQAMRSRLGAQREADEILAEASQLRGTAAEDAERIVAEAEALAAQLVEEARASAESLTNEAREAAERLTTEAQERSDGILARAWFEAEDLQRHTEEERARIRDEVLAEGRAEIQEFRTRTVGLLDDAESGLRDVAPSLEAAVATVAGVLRSLDELRNGPGEPAAAEPAAGSPAARELASAPDTSPAAEPPAVDDGNGEARPLGWLFRASQS